MNKDGEDIVSLVAYVCADNVERALHLGGSAKLIDIWRDTLLSTATFVQYAIVQDTLGRRRNYIVVNLNNVVFNTARSCLGRGSKTFVDCWEFEDLDQAIMACSMKALG